MKLDDREWQDPDGMEWNDLNYGQGDRSYAGGIWWVILMVLLIFAVASLFGES